MEKTYKLVIRKKRIVFAFEIRSESDCLLYSMGYQDFDDAEHVGLMELAEFMRQEKYPGSPYGGAWKKGFIAAAEGKKKSACPYKDHRCGRNEHIVTFSRAFIRYWMRGFAEGEWQLEKAEKFRPFFAVGGQNNPPFGFHIFECQGHSRKSLCGVEFDMWGRVYPGVDPEKVKLEDQTDCDECRRIYLERTAESLR